MCDSPRPDRTVPAALTGIALRSGAFRAGIPVRSVGALSALWRTGEPLRFANGSRLPGVPQWLAGMARPVLATLPLALAVVAVPAHAAHRMPPRPAAHAPAHTLSPTHPRSTAHAPSAAASFRSREVTGSRAAAHASSSAHGRSAAEASAAAIAGHRGKAVAAARPLTRRERAAELVEERQESLAALRERSGKFANARGAATRVGAHSPWTREAEAEETASITVPRGLGRQRGTTAPLSSRVTEDTDVRADARTESRVHAWYRTHHPDAVATDSAANPAGDTDTRTAPRPAKQVLPAATSTTTAVARAAAPADLSTRPRQATAADFAHAAAVQRETIAATRDQQAHQTTAGDDAADAESRIPSTAPTEREPAPFVHGSFGDDPTAVPANRSQRGAAPILRGAPAPATVAANIAPPQHVDLKHRGDGLNSALAADAETSAGNPLPARPGNAALPATAAATNAPRAIRALAEQTAASPTPMLKLPTPPSGALRKPLPAVSAVESGARRRALDPTVANGMAEQTFDEDGAPATARTAVALAAPAGATVSPVAGLVPARTHDLPLTGVADGSVNPAVVVNLLDRDGRLISVPPMKGSHEILVHQNQMALLDGLERIQDDRDLLDLRQRRLLVALPDEDSVYPDDRLPANRRYARPWTVLFLRDLAKAHYQRFGTPLIVTSAARTVEFQRRLVRVNGNAAPPTGDVASPHLYGQAIDIAKGHMSLTELMWMRAYLTPVENDGKIDVEEEFQQSCFHLSVYRRYLGLPAPNRNVSPAANPPAPLLTATTQAPPPADSKPAEKKHHRISTALLATGLR